MEKGILREFILENLDKAINEGHIKLYYQPIIRTLTGEICAMEGLARWIDPKIGMISPADFVPILENEKLIYKLDSYLVKQMCKEYALANSQGEDMLPVSLNFSRLDFEEMDVYEIIEEYIKEYKVPRDMLNIEITETTAGKSKDFVKKQVDKLRRKGYEVWMDDFGSEYSSLNILKEYSFDVVKIDMKFIDDDSLKGRQIIRFIVDMLKTIGVRTLVEGVETKEQYEFLCDIGCDRIQGYYIGVPTVGENVKKYIFKKGFKVEKHIDKKYNDEISKVNILSQTPIEDLVNIKKEKFDPTDHIVPLALIEINDKTLTYKYYNKQYLYEVKSMGFKDVKELQIRLSNENNALRKKINFLLNASDKKDKPCVIDYFYNGNLCMLKIYKVAEEGKRVTYICKLNNINNNEEIQRYYDRKIELNEFCKYYDGVDIIDLEKNEIKSIYTTYKSIVDFENMSFDKYINIIAENDIYMSDREKFISFYNPENIKKRMIKSNKKVITIYYRMLIKGHGYKWCMANIIQKDENDENRYLSCIRFIEDDEVKEMPMSMKACEDNDIFNEAVLWQNFTANTDIGMFWKDKDRRFVGVNRAFLDYYGIRSIDNVVGKNDEDMGWHIEPDKFKNDEEDIINKGIQTHGVQGTCLNNGSVRNIMASKMPYYRDGNIEGIIGYFVEQGDSSLNKETDPYIDSMTGVLNMKGMLDSIQQYVDSYILHRYDFVIYYLDIVDFRHFIETNGQKLSTRVLQEVANKIKEKVGLMGVVSRIGGDHFVIIKSVVTDKEDEHFLQDIKDDIYDIRRIDDIPCTIYLEVEYEKFSNVKNLENLLLHLVNKSIRADK